jgi:[ribosomal protein S18]-alanine N-acetyltransferase
VVELRPFSSSDDLELLSWFQTAADLRRFAGDGVGWPLTRAQLDEWRVDPRIAAWSAWSCAVEDETVVGHAQLISSDPDSGHLARLAVAPSFQGHGYGRAVVAAVLANACLLGLQFVTLNVYRDNERAIRLYRSLGFVELSSPGSRPDVMRMGRTVGGTALSVLAHSRANL